MTNKKIQQRLCVQVGGCCEVCVWCMDVCLCLFQESHMACKRWSSKMQMILIMRMWKICSNNGCLKTKGCRGFFKKKEVSAKNVPGNSRQQNRKSRGLVWHTHCFAVVKTQWFKMCKNETNNPSLVGWFPEGATQSFLQVQPLNFYFTHVVIVRNVFPSLIVDSATSCGKPWHMTRVQTCKLTLVCLKLWPWSTTNPLICGVTGVKQDLQMPGPTD